MNEHWFIDLTIGEQQDLRDVTIATLGPPGTSSEAAAHHFGTMLPAVVQVELHDSYEQAAASLAKRQVEFVVLANAYAQASRFYMNPTFCLAGAFVLDTPAYGLAASADSPRSGQVSVATHPAPEPLIDQLMPSRYQVGEVVMAGSTSLAAAAVREGDVDLALTTAPAAVRHALTFISPSRHIRMLWSVFTRMELVPSSPEKSAH
jgi:prephenate dehydratase